jgi:hypothetical protein
VESVTVMAFAAVLAAGEHPAASDAFGLEPVAFLTSSDTTILGSKLVLVICFLRLRWILFWWLLSCYVGLRLLT